MQDGLSGQGVLLTVLPQFKLLFLAWFTYDLERPAPGTEAILGDPGHRWLSAIGPYQGNLAELQIEVTRDGIFGQPLPESGRQNDGTIHLEFRDCKHAIMEYRIDSLELEGRMELIRIVDDNVPLCQALGLD
jgi:hypothetical protein